MMASRISAGAGGGGGGRGRSVLAVQDSPCSVGAGGPLGTEARHGADSSHDDSQLLENTTQVQSVSSGRFHAIGVGC